MLIDLDRLQMQLPRIHPLSKPYTSMDKEINEKLKRQAKS